MAGALAQVAPTATVLAGDRSIMALAVLQAAVGASRGFTFPALIPV